MIAKKGWPYLVVALLWGLLVVFENDYLWTAQEQNLFLHTPLFFEQQMVKAGGLLTWVGCYLTQFFYYPMLGAGVLCLLWLFFMWLSQRAFRLTDTWPTLVPVGSLLLTVVTLGYWVYYQKLQGVLFVATVGIIVAVALSGLYRWVTGRGAVARLLFLVLSTCISYPLFGFYGLLGTALMAMTEHEGTKTQRISAWMLALLSVITVPQVCYHTLYHETNIVNIYWTALPVFAMHGESFSTYYIPYVILFASTAVMAVCPRVSSAPLRRWASVAVLAATTVWVSVSWYKDDNFHRELSMSRCMDEGRWEQMLETARNVKGEPTRAICLMRNLALFRLGQTGDETVNYPNGSALPNAPFPVRMIHTIGKRLYLEYGIPNYCYRWCMEDGVEYGWTAERLRLMMLCSLTGGEFVAAQRYISMLKKTDFHGPWARRYEETLYRPQRIADDPALKPVLPLLREANFLTSDQSQLEHFLIEHLLSMGDANREQQDLTRFVMRYYQRNRCRIIEP